MTKADLSKKANYATMQRVGGILNDQDRLETAEDIGKQHEHAKK